MRVVIRADAGAVPEIGTGHVVRSLELAKGLPQADGFRDSDVLFATRRHSPFDLGSELIADAGFECISDAGLEPNSISEFESIAEARPDVVILDRLATSSEFVTRLKNEGIFVVTFDDLGPGQKYADVAIHALLQDVEARPNVFIGYEYLILPSRSAGVSKVTEPVSRVFISFGGFDQRGLVNAMLDTLPSIPLSVEYDIVVGIQGHEQDNGYCEAAQVVREKTNKEVRLHSRPKDFESILRNSDLAIVSGGMTAFECARFGVPAIGLPQYEHQLENLRRLERLGCLKLGSVAMEFDPKKVANILTDLSDDHRRRKNMSDCGKRLIDGRGLERVVKIVENAGSWR